MIQRDRAATLILLDGIQAAMELLLSSIIRYRRDVLMQRVDHIDEHGYVHWKREESCPTPTPRSDELHITSAASAGVLDRKSVTRLSKQLKTRSKRER